MDTNITIPGRVSCTSGNAGQFARVNGMRMTPRDDLGNILGLNSAEECEDGCRAKTGCKSFDLLNGDCTLYKESLFEDNNFMYMVESPNNIHGDLCPGM